MFNSRLSFLFIAYLFFFQENPVNAQSPPFLADSVSYLWPTNASQQLSSTFAETRSNHLHAGLDIRTWGQEGYRVFATRDGIIHSIGMSPYGYGNVIFMKHFDDSYSVYAHLNRFEPKLQAYADSIRFIDYTADLNLIIENENLYYKKGDVIGYTGSTGVGPPHLHFELRTPDFKPFNPLLTNLRVQDTIPPVFRQLGIEFLHPKTLKPMDHKIVNATRSGSNYSFGEITASGPIGLSVNVHDRANQTPNVYAVYSLVMTHGADTLFHSQADYFYHSYADHMFLDRSYSILAETRRGFQRLFRVHGNRLPFYHIVENHGILQFEDGRYPIKIIASDIFGNESTATITVHFQDNEAKQDIVYVPTYPEAFPVHSVNPEREISPIINWSSKQMTDNEPILISTIGNTVPFQRMNTSYRILTPNSVEKTMVPNKTSRFTSPDQNFWLEFPRSALYDTLQLQLEIVKSDNEIHFNFTPDRLPVNGNIYFNYILPPEFKGNDKLALYSVDKFRNREFYRASTNINGFIRAPLREIGSVVLKEDNTAPWIGRARLDRNLAGNHVVIVPTRDRETGIDHRRSTIEVNGQRGIIEYDPEKNFLIFYNPSFRPAASNQLKIEVFDGVGNRTISNQTISR